MLLVLRLVDERTYPVDVVRDLGEDGRLELAALVVLVGADGEAGHAVQVPLLVGHVMSGVVVVVLVAIVVVVVVVARVLVRAAAAAAGVAISRVGLAGGREGRSVAVDLGVRLAGAEERTARVADARMNGPAYAQRVHVDLGLDGVRLDVVAARLVGADGHVGHLQHARHDEVVLVVGVHEAVAHDLAARAHIELHVGGGQAGRHELGVDLGRVVLELDERDVVERTGRDALLERVVVVHHGHVALVDVHGGRLDLERLALLALVLARGGRRLPPLRVHALEREHRVLRMQVLGQVVVAVGRREHEALVYERAAAVGLRVALVGARYGQLSVPRPVLGIGRQTVRHIIGQHRLQNAALGFVGRRSRCRRR